MTGSRMCTCAAGCARNPMADPGVFGEDCSCWCHARTDPLLSALADACQRKEQAEYEIGLLLAYAREVVTPRPYRLADLAAASGLSISGVRIAYTAADVERITALLAARDRAASGHGQPAA
jgi:hypothetical protein